VEEQMTRNTAVLMLGGLALPLIAAYGGWASITLESLPDHLVAGQPVELTYTVRQHGFEPMRGLNGRIEARSGTLSLNVASQAAGPGQYTATLTVPEPGEWTITIFSGFYAKSFTTLMPIRAIAAGAAAPAPRAAADRGRRLFVAKGCITCHTHRQVQPALVDVGPELSQRRFEADYLSRFLADPARELARRNSGKEMPNLHLKAQEIELLVAFLNGGSNVSGL
jgi:mono/diheme cytochrome c family protein